MTIQLTAGAEAKREGARLNDGKFGHQVHAEPDSSVTLAPAPKRIVPRSKSELVKLLPQLDYDSLEDPESMAIWVDAAQQAARFWNEHYGVERRSNVHAANDVAQEALAEVWQKFREGKAAPEFPRLYLVSIVANKAVRGTADGKRFPAEDRRAKRELDAMLEKIQKAEGRNATIQEYDDAKAKVLREWHDPKHKPSKDFDKTQDRATSLDRPVGSDDSAATLGSLLPGKDTVDNDIAAASLMDQVFQDSESRGEKAIERRNRQVWNAIAERNDLPHSVPGQLSQEQVDAHRQSVAEHGGIQQAIQDWKFGEDTPAVQALVAPFGDLPMKQEQAAVMGLEKFTRGYNREQADAMFASVLDSAGPEGQKDMEHYAKERVKVLAGEDSATKRARKATATKERAA